jgi:hypothetical protein
MQSAVSRQGKKFFFYLSNPANPNRHSFINQKFIIMTKAVIITGVALGALLVTGVILSLAAPKKIAIVSSQFIHASKQEVFDQLRYMKNFPRWSPFLKQDPDQKFAISGTDGGLGATFSWEGVKEKSKGFQKIVSLSGNSQLKIQCTITEPFQSNPTFNYTLVEKNGGIEVMQQFETDMPVPANVFGLLMGLKGEIAANNKMGLKLLQQVTEKKETVTIR